MASLFGLDAGWAKSLAFSFPHLFSYLSNGCQGIVPFVDSLVWSGNPCCVRVRPEWRHTWQVAEDIANALHALNERGVIHRNPTPTNILRCSSNGQAKLGDWMLAKALEGDLAIDITKSERLLGEIPYMAPERTSGERNADIHADIYGLGATLYALLTGQPPAKGSSLPELLSNVRYQQPTRPSKYHRTVPAEFEDIVLKMIAKNPDDRYQTPQAILDDLESFRLGRPVAR